MANKQNFWNRIANKYASTPIADEAAYEYKLDATREYLNKTTRVLEVGCGTGSTALKHAPFVKEIVATDFSQNMLEIAEQKANEQNVDNVNFVCESIYDCASHQGQYDVIMAHSILHLLEDLDTAIATLFSKLAPGGIFISSTACINDMMWFFKYVAPLGHALRLIPYVNCFAKSDLIDSLKSTGFNIEMDWKPKPNAAVFIVAKKPLTFHPTK